MIVDEATAYQQVTATDMTENKHDSQSQKQTKVTGSCHGVHCLTQDEADTCSNKSVIQNSHGMDIICQVGLQAKELFPFPGVAHDSIAS